MKYIPKLPKDHKNYRYDKRSQELNYIISDKKYMSKITMPTYSEFIKKMYEAIVFEKKISLKMSRAIDSIILKYVNKEKNTKTLLKKVDTVYDMVVEDIAHPRFTETKEFLDSIRKSVVVHANLTDKQKLVLNKIYKETKVRIAGRIQNAS